MSFEPVELERYARHIVLHEVGGPGQQRLKSAKVLVVGAGGLGSPAILYLAAAGVGTLGVVDDDTVSLSNLQRQVIHTTDRIGRSKIESAGDSVENINPHVDFVGHDVRLNEENIDGIFLDYDLILDGCDNFSTRYLVNEACTRAEKPLISAAMGRWEGQISLFDPTRGGPCYRCVFPRPPEDGMVPACAEAGVIGALPGVLGSMMALEAIKEISGAGVGLRGVLLIYDSLGAEFRRMRTSADPKCPVCSGRGADQ